MAELNQLLRQLLRDSGINTIPPPEPITIMLPNGVKGDFQAVLDTFKISRNTFDALSLTKVKEYVERVKEILLLSGSLSDTLQDYLNFIVEVKASVEGGQGEY